MSRASIAPETIDRLRAEFAACGSKAEAARRVGVDRHTAAKYLYDAAASRSGTDHSPVESGIPPRNIAVEARRFDQAEKAMRRGALSLDEIAASAGCTRGAALDWLDALKARSVNVRPVDGERFALDPAPQPAYASGTIHEYVSRPDNTFVFGAVGDSHLGSKYERLDVLNDLYDAFAAAGVDRVYHTGNWIDGEASFNRFDIHTHGMDAQIGYLAEKYPRRDGIATFAVHGDDHEGWYGQREGIDIGRHALSILRDHGRLDWHDLGFMESHVRLVNANTGKAATMAVVHPGGGSAYAISYTVQKIVESFEGGEKPAVLLAGHYHKMEALNVRNVWTLQTGCTQDQTPFMRKKRLEAHVGGVLVTLGQDPETGAITRFVPDMRRYFNRSYYSNGRWSKAGPVALPDRRA